MIPKGLVDFAFGKGGQSGGLGSALKVLNVQIADPCSIHNKGDMTTIWRPDGV
jgi:hypothetical protein